MTGTGDAQGFAEDAPEEAGVTDRLLLDLDGFEGPIDVLLTLAREQKVDLSRIKILQLADQYLEFIARARTLRLDLAADYLVMAAWLAYLKSRLLLPEPPADDEPSGPSLAADLAFQLRRLEAMQQAGVALMALPRLGIDRFARGAPESLDQLAPGGYAATLYELLSAYGAIRGRSERPTLTIAATQLYSVEQALARFRQLLGHVPDWATLARFLPEELGGDPMVVRSALAATFAASLELARDGDLELRQVELFGPIYVRSRRPEALA